MGGHLPAIIKIQDKIYSFRNLHVMIDRDIAEFYRVETRAINQAVKRNPGRFPSEFCFRLNDSEYEYWKSQIVMSNKDKKGLRRPPYVFTEQGVAMLSAVLNGKTAVAVSVQIMSAFVAMRKFLSTNAGVFKRLDSLEFKQIQTEKKIDKIFTAIEIKSVQPKQGIFYNGQVFDAWNFVSNLVRSADKSLVLIDNYVDDKTLSLFTKRKNDVTVRILTKKVMPQFEQDVKKFNEQYAPVELREFELSHDRFLIIDDKDIYHFGASLKDLGKKWFAFSKMDIKAVDVLKKAGL